MAENEKSSEISGEDVRKSTPKPSPSKSTGKSMKNVISFLFSDSQIKFCFFFFLSKSPFCQFYWRKAKILCTLGCQLLSHFGIAFLRSILSAPNRQTHCRWCNCRHIHSMNGMTMESGLNYALCRYEQFGFLCSIWYENASGFFRNSNLMLNSFLFETECVYK